MQSRPTRLALLCTGMACAGVLAAGSDALAATGKLYVSHAPIPASGKTSCNKPNFNSIGAAVSSGTSLNKTVIVCTGTYAEQVTITHALTLQGNTGAVLVPPGGPTDHWNGALIQIGDPTTDTSGAFGGLQAVTTVKSMTVDGQNRAGTAAASGRGFDAPVGIRADNANAQITSNVVENIDDADAFGAQSGNAIFVHASNGVVVTNAKVTNNTVSNFQKTGVLVDAGSVPGETWTAGGGVVGQVATNQITAHRPDRPDRAERHPDLARRDDDGDRQLRQRHGLHRLVRLQPDDTCDTAAGILLFEAGSDTVVSANTVSQFDIGIDVEDSNGADVTSNTLHGGRSTEDLGLPAGAQGHRRQLHGAVDG